MQSYYKRNRYGNATTSQSTLYSIRAVAGNTTMGRVSVSGNATTLTTQTAQKETARYARFTTSTATLTGYAPGTPIHIVAAPNPGYRFVQWVGLPASQNWQSVRTQPSLSFNAQCNLDITAEFAAEQRPPQTVYTVRATVNNPSAGRVQPETQTVNAGNSVTLSASPFEGFRFVRWDGVGTLAGNMQDNASRTITITPRADVSAVAVFEPESNATPGDENQEIGITDPEKPVFSEIVNGSPENTGPATSQPRSLASMIRKYWWIIAAVLVYWISRKD